MKKYIFLIKRAIKNEVEIDAENKNEAFKKLVNLVTEDEDKILQNDPDKQIMRFKLKEIIEKNEDGKEEKYQYKRDEELVKIIEELDENEDDFRSNFRKYL